MFGVTNHLRQPKPTGPSSAGKRITVALAGNPNSGKTTIFNALTGGRQHVGNYPGVTVEKKEGQCRHGRTPLRILDLPGTYSLTAYSIEERVARDVLIHDQPDVVIDILDASNLERNLYLAVQIMELGRPLVLVMNMSDVARQRGLEFDLDLLSRLLGVPIVSTIGHKGIGLRELLDTAVEAGERGPIGLPRQIDYGPEIETEIANLQRIIEQAGVALNGIPARWFAVKLLEGDPELHRQVNHEAVIEAAGRSARQLESILGDSPEALIADRRYGHISGACQQAVRSTVELRHTLSDHIDAVATHRVLGLPIFLGLMYAVFHLTFTLGGPPMAWIEAGFDWLAQTLNGLWPEGADGPLRSLLIDGVIGGVSGVLVFLPNILLLFLAIAILEDSGYMARAAFLMDRLMYKIGLHGKSFVPMLIGFGCSVPAIMATRTLENRRDRLTTMLVLPLMSCGARLPIYALIIPAFFPRNWHAPMLWIIYLIGILLAVICAKLLKKTLLRGETPPFVMELPPYRMPTLKSVGLHMWNRGGAYLKKAGTIILGISIVLWALQQWPSLPEEQAQAFARQREQIEVMSDLPSAVKNEALVALNYAEAKAALEASLMGRIGRGLEPILRPCGFDWKIATAMVGAFAAKEVFVVQMGIVYALGEAEDEDSEPLRDRLRADYTPLQGFCIMLFCLISAPCMATIAITRRESNSWRWALFQLGGLTALAWVVTTVVYQVGRLVS
ncbi:MAG: ferrous iron transport protein B [Phycisphaerales bacterium]|nr:ferrous iron transport protein B [Phycisphaerales bacterium]